MTESAIGDRAKYIFAIGGNYMATEQLIGRRKTPMLYGDVPSFLGMPVARQPSELQGAGAVLLGIPFDGIATYRGGATRLAPQYIRKFSLLWSTYNLSIDIDFAQYIKLMDYGDVDVVPGEEMESYRRAEERLSHILSVGAVPIGMGGDHGISIPMVRAVARAQKQTPLGVIIFDTHHDMIHDLDGNLLTRASPTRRIIELPQVDPRRVVIIGLRGPRNPEEGYKLAREKGITCFTMDTVDEQGIVAVARKALAIACPDGGRPYLSVDIDSFDPGYAPATNSPDPGGFSPRELIKGLRIVAERGFCGFDIVEVVPEYDNTGGITSTLASRIITEAIGCLALAKRQGLM
jgi:agmatinase